MFQIFTNLLDDIKEGGVLCFLLSLLFVHMLDKLDERVLDLATGIREYHHNKVLDEWLSRMEVFRSLIVDDRWVMKFAEPTKIHRNFIIESHQLGRLVEVFQVFVVVEHFYESFDQFSISVHGVLIEAVVEVIGKFLVLCFAVGGIGEIVLVERVLEDVLGLHYVDWPSSHLYI